MIYQIKRILKKLKLKEFPSPEWAEILKDHKQEFLNIKKKS